MQLIFRAGECKNGPCPTIYDADDGRVAVQGPLLVDSQALSQLDGMPAHESVVLIPRELMIEYVRRIGTRL